MYAEFISLGGAERCIVAIQSQAGEAFSGSAFSSCVCQNMYLLSEHYK